MFHSVCHVIEVSMSQCMSCYRGQFVTVYVVLWVSVCHVVVVNMSQCMSCYGGQYVTMYVMLWGQYVML